MVVPLAQPIQYRGGGGGVFAAPAMPSDAAPVPPPAAAPIAASAPAPIKPPIARWSRSWGFVHAEGAGSSALRLRVQRDPLAQHQRNLIASRGRVLLCPRRRRAALSPIRYAAC